MFLKDGRWQSWKTGLYHGNAGSFSYTGVLNGIATVDRIVSHSSSDILSIKVPTSQLGFSMLVSAQGWMLNNFFFTQTIFEMKDFWNACSRLNEQIYFTKNILSQKVSLGNRSEDCVGSGFVPVLSSTDVGSVLLVSCLFWNAAAQISHSI